MRVRVRAREQLERLHHKGACGEVRVELRAQRHDLVRGRVRVRARARGRGRGRGRGRARG